MCKTVALIILALVVASNSYPRNGYRYVQPGTIMLGGHYGIPSFRYSDFFQQNGNPFPDSREQEFEEEAISAADEEEQISVKPTKSKNEPNDESSEPELKRPKGTSNRRKLDNDDNDSSFPPSMGESSIFNTFFPISMGGGSRGKQGEDEGSRGAATAIANSWSTGRGGLASSHATSFGDVYLSSSSLKDRNSRKRDVITTENQH